MWNLINKIEEIILVLLTPLYILYYRMRHIHYYSRCRKCNKLLIIPVYLRLGLCFSCHRKLASDINEEYYTESEYGKHEFGGGNTSGFSESYKTDHDNLYSRLAKCLRDGMILDVGCGYGLILSRLKKPSNILHGIEVTIKAVQIAKNIVGEGFFCVAKGENIPFESNTFDCLVCSEVLEHLTEEQGNAVLLECYRVLKPGGTAIFTVPNGKGVSGMLPYHIRFFTFNSFLQTVKAIGYEIVGGQTYGFWVPFVSRFVQILLLISGNRLPLNAYINIRVPEFLASNFLIECRKRTALESRDVLPV